MIYQDLPKIYGRNIQMMDRLCRTGNQHISHLMLLLLLWVWLCAESSIF